MSPEYNIYVKANLPGPKTAGELVATISTIPGVEVVQMNVDTPYVLVPNPDLRKDPAGSIIREERMRLGLRQIDVANAVGIGNSSLSKIEHGRRSSVATLEKIADVLGIAEDDPRRVEMFREASKHSRRRYPLQKP